MNTKNIVLTACAVAVLGLGASVVFSLLTIEQFGIVSLAVISALYGLVDKFSTEKEELEREVNRYEMTLDNEVIKRSKLQSEVDRLNKVSIERSVEFNRLKKENFNLKKDEEQGSEAVKPAEFFYGNKEIKIKNEEGKLIEAVAPETKKRKPKK